MRVLVFGCLHVPDRPTAGSSALAATLDWLMQQATHYRVDAVVCLGDTVETPSRTPVPVNVQVKAVLDRMKELASRGVHVWWMLGNHDIYSRALSVLGVFDAPPLQFVTEACMHELAGCRLAFAPYAAEMDAPGYWSRPHYQQKLSGTAVSAFFCHLPISGMPMGGTHDNGVDMRELAAAFDVVFAGHYHQAAQFPVEGFGIETPFVVPGSVLGQNFRDTGWFHGAVLWEWQPGQAGGQCWWLANPHSHYFFTGTAAEFEQAAQTPAIAPLLARTHVRLSDGDPSQYEQVGAASVEIRPRLEVQQPSGRTPFELDSEPLNDLECWLKEQGVHGELSGLLKKAEKYLAKGPQHVV